MSSYQAAYQQILIKVEMMHYNNMVLHCYKECVHDFNSVSIKPEEQKCGESCSKRFLKSFETVSRAYNNLNSKS